MMEQEKRFKKEMDLSGAFFVKLLISFLLFVCCHPAFSDTQLLTKLDIRDVWTYNYNASHWIEQGNLEAGKSMYGEEYIPIVSVPDEIRGADWIQTAYGSKNYTGEIVAEFEMKEDGYVYLVHHSAIADKPAWMAAYSKESGILSTGQGDFQLYKRKYAKGEKVVLGNNGDTNFPMYIVALVPEKGFDLNKPEGKNVLDISDLGAIGDGKTINTAAIQQAIDRCAKKKEGGVVYIHGGVFITGTLELKSNVTLYVEAGSVLRGSSDYSDYPEKKISLPSYRANEHFQLIFAEKQKNVRITGGGIIDGYSLGEGWPFKGRNNEHERPRLIRMVQCEGVTVEGITLIRSANWTQYYEACRDMKFTDIRVRCYTGQHNQDGIDLSACSHVVVKNFHALCGDDAICFKAMSLVPAEDILVDGVFSRYANCNLIKIGTETHGNIKNLTVRNVEGKTRYGVAIEAVDGSILENITYENFDLWNCASPLLIRLGNRGRTFEGGPDPAPVGSIRNVTIRNVKNRDIGYVDVRNGPGVGAAIAGIPGHKIENLLIEDCDFLFYGSIRDKDFVYRDVPENENKYPEFNIVGTCPSYGTYFRHVDGLRCKNLTIRAKNVDIRPAIVLEDVNDYHFENVKCERFTITEPEIIWNKTQ